MLETKRAKLKNFGKVQRWTCQQESVRVYWQQFRGVAQTGSALAWGARGPGFKSLHPDTVEKALSQQNMWKGLFVVVVSGWGES